MFEREDVKFLASFKSNKTDVLSVYLNCDGSQFLPKKVYTSLKSLTNRKKLEIDKIDDKNLKKELLGHFEKLENHVLSNYREFKHKGLAFFLNKDFFYEIPLPLSPRNRAVISYAPYILPLQFQQDLYGKTLFVIFDKHFAKFYLITTEKISFLKDLSTKVPPKVKRGGWQGYDEKKNARKVDEKTLHHFKRVAEETFEIFKERELDGVVVACKNEYFEGFKEQLHAYVKDKLIENVEMTIDTPEHEIFQKVNNVLSIKRLLNRRELINKLIETSESGGKAVLGLENTIYNLNKNKAEHIVLLRDYDCEGRLCIDCGNIAIFEDKCPTCGGSMIKIDNLITEIVDRALLKGVEVTQISEGLGLEKYGNIGAFLRY